MEEKVRELCDRAVAGRTAIRKKVAWETDANSMAILSSLICLSKNRDIDAEAYARCKRIFKKNVNVFSEFRGVAEAMVITKMTMEEDPEKYIQGAVAVYKKLRAIHKLTASAYMVMAALTIYEHTGVEGADAVIEKLEEIYKEERRRHPFLTDDSDRPFFAMLITSGLGVDELIQSIEECYEDIKREFFSKNTVHSMAQIMSLSSKATAEKTKIVLDYLDGMKSEGKPISRSYGLPGVGAMTMLDMPVHEMVQKTAEIDDYLKTQKGFKWYSVAPRIRRMYAQMILMLAYLPENNTMLASIMTSTMTMALMEEIMMMIIVTNTAMMTASSSASASSGS